MGETFLQVRTVRPEPSLTIVKHLHGLDPPSNMSAGKDNAALAVENVRNVVRTWRGFQALGPESQHHSPEIMAVQG
jgi:hypothetical protein